jgi:hypothetical protein
MSQSAWQVVRQMLSPRPAAIIRGGAAASTLRSRKIPSGTRVDRVCLRPFTVMEAFRDA